MPKNITIDNSSDKIKTMQQATKAIYELEKLIQGNSKAMAILSKLHSFVVGRGCK